MRSQWDEPQARQVNREEQKKHVSEVEIPLVHFGQEEGEHGRGDRRACDHDFGRQGFDLARVPNCPDQRQERGKAQPHKEKGGIPIVRDERVEIRRVQCQLMEGVCLLEVDRQRLHERAACQHRRKDQDNVNERNDQHIRPRDAALEHQQEQERCKEDRLQLEREGDPEKEHRGQWAVSQKKIETGQREERVDRICLAPPGAVENDGWKDEEDRRAEKGDNAFLIFDPQDFEDPNCIAHIEQDWNQFDGENFRNDRARQRGEPEQVEIGRRVIREVCLQRGKALGGELAVPGYQKGPHVMREEPQTVEAQDDADEDQNDPRDDEGIFGCGIT